MALGRRVSLLDVQTAAPAAAQAFSPGLLEASFAPAPAANSKDMFDQAFGAPASSPFSAPPVATVSEIHQDVRNGAPCPTWSSSVVICFLLTIQQTAGGGQTLGSTDAFGDPFGNPFAWLRFCSEVRSQALNSGKEVYTCFTDLISSCLLLSALTDEAGKRRYSRNMTPLGMSCYSVCKTI